MVGPKLPIVAFALAGGAAIMLLLAGVNSWLVAITIVAWIGSFFLFKPAEIATQRVSDEAVQLTRTGMRTLIEHSGLPMMMLDRSRIIAANKAAREQIGSHVTGQDARIALRHPAAVDLLNRPGGGTDTIQGLTGPRSIWQMTCQPIDERYSLIELLNRTVEADISRAHTDFVANASHELRTPLSSIIGYMETLDDAGEDLPRERVTKFYSTVLGEARRLQNLVEDLMSLSRIEAEKHEQPSEKIDLVPLIQQAARDGAGPKRIDRVEFNIPSKSMIVRGDSDQLEQLTRNLVDNALKYGGAEELVTVSLEPSERDMAVLTVQDRGEGIAREHLPHLTRRFYRTDPGRSRASGGTGLGLAIVKHIVERHRGRLDIVSKLGVGTTVAIRIPCAN